MTWIPISERMPPVGTECLVIQDYNLGDWFDKQRVPLRVVYHATLREIDSEGWPTFERWRMNGYAIHPLYLVSHWQPLPSIEGAVFEELDND